VLLARFVLDQLHPLLVDRIGWILFCCCGKFERLLDSKLQPKERIEPCGCLRRRGSQLITSRNKPEQLIVVTLAKIISDLIIRILGPCEPRFSNLKVLEVVWKHIHMILVLMRYDRQVQMSARRLVNVGNDCRNIRKTE